MKTRSKIGLLIALSLLAGMFFGCTAGGDRSQAGAATTSDRLTKEEAENAALAHAGLSRDQVRFSRTEYELDDGRPEYEIEFHFENTEYDYTVHADTGQILSWEKS